jgi:methyl-accepting chemotaxis protein
VAVKTNQEKAGLAAEKLAETTRESYQVVVEHLAGLQERNVRFAQSVIDESIEELRRQVESNRALAQELAERTEKQRGAYQELVNESVDAYMDLLYAPLGFYKRNLEAVR